MKNILLDSLLEKSGITTSHLFDTYITLGLEEMMKFDTYLVILKYLPYSFDTVLKSLKQESGSLFDIWLFRRVFIDYAKSTFENLFNITVTNNDCFTITSSFEI